LTSSPFPGALEIPPAIAMALDAMDEGGAEYDGFVALGVVIRGETHHFDIVANESARGLMTLVGFRIACPRQRHHDHRKRRAGLGAGPKDRLDKGGFAARAALTMIALKDRLAG
jgi:6,7-dimethyl-8-ribityllumazine synthase